MPEGIWDELKKKDPAGLPCNVKVAIDLSDPGDGFAAYRKE